MQQKRERHLVETSRQVNRFGRAGTMLRDQLRHHSKELLQRNRFGEHRVHGQFLRTNLVLRAEACARKEDDRNVVTTLPSNLLEDGKSVAAGQHDVQGDELGTQCLHLLEGSFAIGRGGYLVALLAESTGQDPEEAGIVIYAEDRGGQRGETLPKRVRPLSTETASRLKP